MMEARRAAPHPEWVQMYRQGIPAPKIAAAAGVGKSTVRYHLRIAAQADPSVRDEHQGAAGAPVQPSGPACGGVPRGTRRCLSFRGSRQGPAAQVLHDRERHPEVTQHEERGREENPPCRTRPPRQRYRNRRRGPGFGPDPAPARQPLGRHISTATVLSFRLANLWKQGCICREGSGSAVTPTTPGGTRAHVTKRRTCGSNPPSPRKSPHSSGQGKGVGDTRNRSRLT